MRTTLDIDGDVLELARGMAQGRSVSIGKALSDLARRGAKTPIKLIERNGVYVIPKDIAGGPFGPEEVQAALDSEHRGSLRSFRKPDA